MLREAAIEKGTAAGGASRIIPTLTLQPPHDISYTYRMSRGLGVGQRKMLAALADLHERHPRLKWFSVPDVVNGIWHGDNLLHERARQRIERQTARDEAESRAWAEYRADIEAQASAGDPAAIQRRGELRRADMIGIAIRSWRHDPRRGRAGAPQRRADAALEALINPSRCTASLARRGLIERSAAMRGYVRITLAGRDALQK